MEYFSMHKHPRKNTDETSHFYAEHCFRYDCCVPLSVFYLRDNYIYTQRLFDKALAEAESCMASLYPGESGVCWQMRVKPGQRILSSHPNVYIRHQVDNVCIVFLTRVQQYPTDDVDYMMKRGSRKRRRCYVPVEAPVTYSFLRLSEKKFYEC